MEGDDQVNQAPASIQSEAKVTVASESQGLRNRQSRDAGALPGRSKACQPCLGLESRRAQSVVNDQPAAHGDGGCPGRVVSWPERRRHAVEHVPTSTGECLPPRRVRCHGIVELAIIREVRALRAVLTNHEGESQVADVDELPDLRRQGREVRQRGGLVWEKVQADVDQHLR